MPSNLQIVASMTNTGVINIYQIPKITSLNEYSNINGN